MTEDIESTELKISNASIQYLFEIGKWSKFLSILGFIIVGIIVIASLFMGSILSNIPELEYAPISGIAIGILYLTIAGIYFFPVLYLYKFSTNLKDALTTRNNENLDLAFLNLKSHYKFIGIMTLITLGFYGITLILAIIVAALT